MTPRRFGLLMIIAVVLFVLLGAAGVYLLVGRGTSAPAAPEIGLAASTAARPESTTEDLEEATTTPILPTSAAAATGTAAAAATDELPSASGTAAPPSPTITTTPPPGLCSQLSLRFISATSSLTRWRLENQGTQAMVISRIETTWPQSNDAIFNVYLDGTVIWSGEDLVPPTIIATWSGLDEDRQLAGEMSLEFFFGTQAAASGYDLSIRFTNGCELAAAR